MHILLAILKVIGIILLVLIGLTLLILALVLFVPIRYMADVSYVEKANGRAQLTWLAHLVSARLWIRDNQISYTLRICGKKISLDQSEPEPQKKKKQPDKNKKTKRKAARKAKKEEPELIEINPEHVTIVKPAPVKPAPEKAEPVKPAPAEKGPAEPVPESARLRSKKKEKSTEKQEEKQRTGFRARIKAAGEKIKNIKYTLKSFYDRIDKTKENISRTWAKLHEEENQASIQLAKNELLKVWKQIKPRRIRGAIVFGTDDPAQTGQILGVCAILYPVYQDNLKITPDFENPCLEGSLYVKGRIRLFPLLMCGFRIYRDKNIRKLYRNLRS